MEHEHSCHSCSACHDCSSCSGSCESTDHHLQEIQVASEEIYNGRILRLTNDTVRLENDELAPREVVHHPGGACIVPLTDTLEVLMVRQFRYPHNEITLEIPAGKLEYGEDPKACAIRELKEEVGATAAQVFELGSLYPTPAYNKEVIHMYLATGLTLSEQSLDNDEFLDVVKMPLAQAIAMIMDNKIQDAKTQIALLKTVQMMSASG